MDREKNNQGFTLLELLGVMGVIVIMSFIVVSGFRSIMLGVGDNSATRILSDSVQLARQHAMQDNSRIFFIVTGIGSYVMCREGGTITDSAKGSVKVSYLDNKSENAFWVYDEYADWQALSDGFTSIYTSDAIEEMINNSSKDAKYKGIVMYDLDEGKSATVLFPPFVNEAKDMWCLGFHNSMIKGDMFGIGHTYGWVLYEERFLPDGYVFDSKHYKLDSDGNFENGSGSIICFNPDGTTVKGPSYVDELTIGEVDPTKSDSIKNKTTINIKGDGTLDVE